MEEAEVTIFTPASFFTGRVSMSYLDFWPFFLSLVGVGLPCFFPRHPQSQSPFLSAMFITSFRNINRIIKYFSNH